MAIATMGRLGLGVALGAGMAALAMAVPAQANPEIQAPLAQAEEQTLVLPFTDVPTDHWAYQALLNLTGVYGCVSGYPDGTFRGDNTVSRYEFAAGMDSCLSAIAGVAQQQAQERNQAVQELINSMEQSLSDLRELETDLPAAP